MLVLHIIQIYCIYALLNYNITHMEVHVIYIVEIKKISNLIYAYIIDINFIADLSSAMLFH